MTAARRRIALALALGVDLISGAARAALPSATEARIDTIAAEWLQRTGAPSVSVAVVKDGALAYAQAYGWARRAPAQRATTATRYDIDSVSKEFTAAALVLLADRGKLSLDDKAGAYVAGLGPAGAATLRQLLSHTAGVRDFWPQDFLPPEMTRPATPEQIVAEWANRKLDFPPGQSWQYSNTGFLVAALAAQHVAWTDLFSFLKSNVFTPLGMRGVAHVDAAPLAAPDAAGFTRYGLGTLAPAPPEGRGWLFGSAELAMTPTTLAKWDIGLLDHAVLSTQDVAEMTTPAPTADGSGAKYGLGLDLLFDHGRAAIGHDGAGSGFFADNMIWPDDRAAIVVLTNNDFAFPARLMSDLADAVLPPTPAETRARALFAALQAGTLDRTQLTANGHAYFTPAVLAALRASLGPLGAPDDFRETAESRRGGFVTRHWQIACGSRHLVAVERSEPAGRIEQFLVLQDET